MIAVAVSLALLVGVSGASFGIVAGQPHISVPIGSSNTVRVTLLNTGSSPITFKVILPAFQSSDNNTIPNVTVSPMTATIPPKTDMFVNVTAYVSPKNNKVNDTWVGILQFVEVSNVTNPGGAVVNAGLAKILTVEAAPPLSSPVPYLIIAIVIIVVVIGSITALYINKSRRRTPSGKTAAERKIVHAEAARIARGVKVKPTTAATSKKKAAAKKRKGSARKKATKTTKTTKRTAARRRTVGAGTRKRASTSRSTRGRSATSASRRRRGGRAQPR